jgi:hypothetical protein
MVCRRNGGHGDMMTRVVVDMLEPGPVSLPSEVQQGQEQSESTQRREVKHRLPSKALYLGTRDLSETEPAQGRPTAVR